MKKALFLVAFLVLLTGASLAITVDLKICDGRGTAGIIWYNPTTEAPGGDLAPVNGATVRVFEDSDLTRYRDFLTDSNGSCVFTAEIADSVNIWKTNYNLYGLTVRNHFDFVSGSVVAAVVKLKKLPRIKRTILPRHFRY